MNESAEDYIKTIYILKRRMKCVRSVDVAREMKFSKASVSIAMSNLRKNGIISVKQDGEIRFTAKGRRIAGHIYEKHILLSGFLCAVAGVDEQTARADACRMEHYLSESTYDGIRSYIKEHPELGII